MKYQITCDNCGTQFLVNGEAGQEIQCECPGCKGKMKFILPKSAYYKSDTNTSPALHDDGDEGHGKWRTLLIGLLVTLVALVVLGMAYYAMKHFGSNNPVEPQKTEILDTIPYEQPEYEESEPIVEDTMMEETPEPLEPEETDPTGQEEQIDTVVAE